jgi:hypothetical protein
MLTIDQRAELFVNWVKFINKNGVKFNNTRANRAKLFALIERDMCTDADDSAFENSNSYTVAFAHLDVAGELEQDEEAALEVAKKITAARAEKERQRVLRLQRQDMGTDGFWTDESGQVHKRHLSDQEIEAQKQEAIKEAQAQYRQGIQGVWKATLDHCETQAEWDTLLHNIRNQVANASNPAVETPIAEKWIRENMAEFKPASRATVTDASAQLKTILDSCTVATATTETVRAIKAWTRATASEHIRKVRKDSPEMATKMDLILVRAQGIKEGAL